MMRATEPSDCFDGFERFNAFERFDEYFFTNYNLLGIENVDIIQQ